MNSRTGAGENKKAINSCIWLAKLNSLLLVEADDVCFLLKMHHMTGA